MAFSIEALFDSKTDYQIRKLWDNISLAGISSHTVVRGSQPHISIVTIESSTSGNWIGKIKDIANRHTPFSISFSSVGIFLSSEGVVFLSPTIGADLKNIYQKVFENLSSLEVPISRLSLPKNWVPHCTVGVKIPFDRFSETIKICHSEKPIIGIIESLAIVELAWPKVKYIETVPLKG